MESAESADFVHIKKVIILNFYVCEPNGRFELNPARKDMFNLIISKMVGLERFVKRGIICSVSFENNALHVNAKYQKYNRTINFDNIKDSLKYFYCKT